MYDKLIINIFCSYKIFQFDEIFQANALMDFTPMGNVALTRMNVWPITVMVHVKTLASIQKAALNVLVRYIFFKLA